MSQIVFLWVTALLLASNITTLSAKTADTKTTEVIVAQKIRSAINHNDIKAFEELSTLPLLVREQEWRSAIKGSGHILGSIHDFTIQSKENFEKKIKPFIHSVMIEGKEAKHEGIVLALFNYELVYQYNKWKGLSLYLFLRGSADVEHIVLLGIDKKSMKLKAIYVN